MATSPKTPRSRQKSSTRKPLKSPRLRIANASTKPRKVVVRKRREPPPFWSRKNLLLLGVEWMALALIALLGTILALGSSAHSFAGSSFFASLLPFAAGVAIWVVIAAILLLTWIKWRSWLRNRLISLPAILALSLSGGMLWFIFHDGYMPVVTHLRSLVGGKQQAERMTLEHQVYAAYRRHGLPQLQKMIDRSAVYNPDIRMAAQIFGLDEHVLQGVAATESSFMPRTSHDGGQGLFQVTVVPKAILQQVARQLATKTLDASNPRHNAFIAAATLKQYLDDMKGDLFMGLLAYNIGPRNGGLRFIMQQYGASDFISMQPYLQQLPRDYPIRVLSYALAFKLWQQDGKLLAYQEGDNAVHIQRIGIPGLRSFF